MARLRWSRLAAQNYEEICEHIGKQSRHHAYKIAREMMTLIESIPKMPRQGSIVPEYGDENLRERLYHKFRIIYRIHGGVVTIAAIVHGARLLPNEAPG
jgi:toxin ParE1/3/4